MENKRPKKISNFWFVYAGLYCNYTLLNACGLAVAIIHIRMAWNCHIIIIIGPRLSNVFEYKSCSLAFVTRAILRFFFQIFSHLIYLDCVRVLENCFFKGKFSFNKCAVLIVDSNLRVHYFLYQYEKQMVWCPRSFLILSVLIRLYFYGGRWIDLIFCFMGTFGTEDFTKSRKITAKRFNAIY